MNLKIKRFIKNIVEKHFSGWLGYSFLTGSWVLESYQKGKSDVDFCVVLKESIRKIPKVNLIKKINFFILDYLKIHKIFNLKPDFLYPGTEILTLKQLEDVFKGRGFRVRKEKIYFNRLKNEEFFDDIDFWYRAWLGMHCWSEYLIGDKEKFLKNRNKCCKFIMKIFLSEFSKEFKKSEFSKIMLRKKEIWRSLGVKEKERKFAIKRFLFPQIKMLTKDGFLNNQRGVIIINQEKLSKFRREIFFSIKKGNFKSSPLFSLRELKNFSCQAKKIWKDL